jgi:hypothetical protein
LKNVRRDDAGAVLVVLVSVGLFDAAQFVEAVSFFGVIR